MRNIPVVRKLSSSGYKKIDDYGAVSHQATSGYGAYPAGHGSYPTGQSAYPAGQGAYPAGQGAYPAGLSGYQTQTGWNSGGGAPPQGWNPAIAPQQGWNQAAAAPPPPSYSSVVNAPSAPELKVDDGNDVPDPLSIPSAPPPQFDSLAGYEGIGYHTGDFLAPPTSFMSTAPVAPPGERPQFMLGQNWTDDEVRGALFDHVSQQCCYGTGTAKDMVITHKIRTGAYHYILETFGESRQVNWTFKPYMGGNVDGPEYGRPPTPWEMPAQTNEYFKDDIKRIEIPHTSHVRPCHTCSAGGMITCNICIGMGRVRCNGCHGSGRRGHGDHRRRCISCHGHGQTTCRKCAGEGRVKCPSCASYCNIRLYIELTVQWKNHLEDFISQESSLPSNLIKDVPGKIAFEEAHMKVWPVNDFLIPEINQASNDLVTKHASIFTSERILQQRQTIRVVPVEEVKYSWKDTKSNYFIYGLDKKVYIEDYPQTCCWGCTIL